MYSKVSILLIYLILSITGYFLTNDYTILILWMTMFPLVWLNHHWIKSENNISTVFPIVVTMVAMTVFEYIFVSIIDHATKKTIKKRMQSKMMNMHTAESKSAIQTCAQVESTYKSYIDKHTRRGFFILLGILTSLLLLNTYHLLQEPKHVVFQTLLNTCISIFMILFVFLYYYSNISSQVDMEPKIEVRKKITD